MGGDAGSYSYAQPAPERGLWARLGELLRRFARGTAVWWVVQREAFGLRFLLFLTLVNTLYAMPTP